MELALREAKARLSELFKAASNGERAIITKQRRPVVELVPCNQRPGGIDFENWRKPTGNLALWVTGRTGQNNSTTRNSAGRFSAWTNDGISGSCRLSSTLPTCLTSRTSLTGRSTVPRRVTNLAKRHLMLFAALDAIRRYGTEDWSNAAQEFLKSRGSLVVALAMLRERHKIPVQVAND